MNDTKIFSTDNQIVQDVDFFHDFIEYLEYLKEVPIQRTVTGNISLKDIEALRLRFKMQEIFKEFEEYGWKINSERVLMFLTKIKIIAEVMHLTYKRKGKICLSGGGKAFLCNLTPFEQYEQMVYYFWNKINWSYFEPGKEIDGTSVIDIFQENRKSIWKILLENGNNWIVFSVFCQSLCEAFQLSKYYEDNDDMKFHLRLDITYGLIRRNLEYFGCLEVKEEEKDKLARIIAIKPTQLGLHMFFEAITKEP